MKNMFESFEVFSAYAEIDLCYSGLKTLQEEISKPITGIDKMIDDATGFTKVKNKENRETIIALVERIITAKKIIEADFSNDELMLNQLKKTTLKQ